MTLAILAASIVAALAAVAGITYQAYVRRPTFTVVGLNKTPNGVQAYILNAGGVIARDVAARLHLAAERYDASERPSVLLPDQSQWFSWPVEGAVNRDFSHATVTVSYAGAFGHRWQRRLPLPN